MEYLMQEKIIIMAQKNKKNKITKEEKKILEDFKTMYCDSRKCNFSNNSDQRSAIHVAIDGIKKMSSKALKK